VGEVVTTRPIVGHKCHLNEWVIFFAKCCHHRVADFVRIRSLVSETKYAEGEAW